ncbi:YqxA family protein [Mesobacillus harenae]|uniref:YqxA family protein n=1 Tax=Mesobacillus harenae TaxID=2213203 RepID=UPI001580CC96|nr:YqxA family protein [Mesobacillus harenae]
MKMFMLKSVLIAALMFLAVLFGMEQANSGIHKMKGYEDPNFKSAFNLSEDESGELETSVLGNKITSHDLEKKKEQLEELKAYNFFSSIGRKLADGLSSAANTVIRFITSNAGG